MKGIGIVSALKTKFRASTDRALSGKIGIAVQGIQNWKNRQKVTERQLASLVHNAGHLGSQKSDRAHPPTSSIEQVLLPLASHLLKCSHRTSRESSWSAGCAS